MPAPVHPTVCCLNLRTCVCLQSLSISVCSGAACWLCLVPTLQFLWSTVWLLDTSHTIFSWSYNDWHNNMFQLTTFFAWWTDVGSSPWNIVQYLIHDDKQVSFKSFISGPSTNRLSISPICLKWQSKEYLLLTGYPWKSGECLGVARHRRSIFPSM